MLKIEDAISPSTARLKREANDYHDAMDGAKTMRMKAG
jgi:hypothetical protein